MAKTASPTWAAIHKRWLRHSVPLIEVLQFDPRWELRKESWAGKGGVGDYPYGIGNPLRDTARRLVEGFESSHSENYAAFLLHCFCTEHNRVVDYALIPVVNAAAHRLGETGRWYATARYVMPFTEVRIKQGLPWHGVVDVAAEAWSDIASRYAVVRIPEFLAFGSDEYRAYQDARRTAEAAAEEDRDRREYARLRAKFEGR